MEGGDSVIYSYVNDWRLSLKVGPQSVRFTFPSGWELDAPVVEVRRAVVDAIQQLDRFIVGLHPTRQLPRVVHDLRSMARELQADEGGGAN